MAVPASIWSALSSGEFAVNAKGRRSKSSVASAQRLLALNAKSLSSSLSGCPLGANGDKAHIQKLTIPISSTADIDLPIVHLL